MPIDLRTSENVMTVEFLKALTLISVGILLIERYDQLRQSEHD